MSIEKGKPSIEVDLFGGRGEVRVWNLLQHASGPFTAVLSCALSAGGSVGPTFKNTFLKW